MISPTIVPFNYRAPSHFAVLAPSNSLAIDVLRAKHNISAIGMLHSNSNHVFRIFTHIRGLYTIRHCAVLVIDPGTTFPSSTYVELRELIERNSSLRKWNRGDFAFLRNKFPSSPKPFAGYEEAEKYYIVAREVEYARNAALTHCGINIDHDKIEVVTDHERLSELGDNPVWHVRHADYQLSELRLTCERMFVSNELFTWTVEDLFHLKSISPA